VKVEFVWSSQAREQLRALDRDTAMRLLLALTRYAETGEGDIKSLRGEFIGLRRLRVGKWRIRFRAVPPAKIPSAGRRESRRAY
jgi:mRNA-degrading endonuclease RelE of RelBE toxin-antitoxin system